jgi:GR25 family glycosyltransferase involved in LPS biosynthesis
MKIHRQEIIMVDAVKGDELNIDTLLSHKKVDSCFDKPDPAENKIKKRELGCYMSHLKTYQKIKEEQRPGYSIVFEDDFDVANYYFIEKVQSIIRLCKNIDFDIIFLGQVLSQNKGNRITENIYEIDKNELLLGTHALLIRNSSIDRILDKVDCKIDSPIDHKLAGLGKSGELTILVIYPFIVNQKGGDSTIQNIHISN